MKICRRILNKLLSWAYPEIYREYIDIYQRKRLNEEWRKLNPHNYTELKYSVYPPTKETMLRVGEKTYGTIDICSYHSPNEGLVIGNYCSIGPMTKFILGGEHNIHTFSTYPFKKKCLDIEGEESFSKGPIVIDDDVWIGQGCIVMSGVHLAKGTIVGAYSVVTKSTKPYAIVCGAPAIVKGYRFNDEIIEKLCSVDMKLLTHSYIHTYIQLLYSQDEYTIKKLIEKINTYGTKDKDDSDVSSPIPPFQRK